MRGELSGMRCEYVCRNAQHRSKMSNTRASTCLLYPCGMLRSGTALPLIHSPPAVGVLLYRYNTTFSSRAGQVIHGTSTVGKPKVDSARDRMMDINPNVKVETFQEQLTSENAMRIVDGYDVVRKRTFLTIKYDPRPRHCSCFVVKRSCTQENREQLSNTILQDSLFHLNVGVLGPPFPLFIGK